MNRLIPDLTNGQLLSNTSRNSEQTSKRKDNNSETGVRLFALRLINNLDSRADEIKLI